MSKFALSLILGLTSAFVQAQPIYKCTGGNGSVTYSQSPCGKDARIVMQAHSADTSAGDERGSPPLPRRPDANIQAISDSVDDSNCRRDAQRLAVAPSMDKIDQANQQIAELNSRIYVNGYGRTSAGNASVVNRQIEEQIISLQQVISSEQTRNQALVAEAKKRMEDALAECDRKKTEREARASK